NKDEIFEKRTEISSATAEKRDEIKNEIKDKKLLIENKKIELEKNKIETKLKLDQKKLELCKKVSENVTQRIIKFNGNKDNNINSYTELRKKVANEIVKLSVKGKDVTKLKADLVIFDQKIKQYTSDYSAFIVTLKGTQKETCGDATGVYKTKTEEARKALETARNSGVEARNFFLTIIKPQLVAFRAELTPSIVSPSIVITPGS
ncbi:MAG: hypothetical protein WCO06_07640, partial [Candidatus Roizmanbacteria bacterium]